MVKKKKKSKQVNFTRLSRSLLQGTGTFNVCGGMEDIGLVLGGKLTKLFLGIKRRQIVKEVL